LGTGTYESQEINKKQEEEIRDLELIKVEVSETLRYQENFLETTPKHQKRQELVVNGGLL
jgi:hypothetical protein